MDFVRSRRDPSGPLKRYQELLSSECVNVGVEPRKRPKTRKIRAQEVSRDQSWVVHPLLIARKYCQTGALRLSRREEDGLPNPDNLLNPRLVVLHPAPNIGHQASIRLPAISGYDPFTPQETSNLDDLNQDGT